MASSLPPFLPFDLSDRNAVGDRKKALMSHYAGRGSRRYNRNIPAPAGDAYEYTVHALNTNFLPQMNTEYTIYEFRTRTQK